MHFTGEECEGEKVWVVMPVGQARVDTVTFWSVQSTRLGWILTSESLCFLALANTWLSGGMEKHRLPLVPSMPGPPGGGSDSVNLLKEKLVLDSIFSSLFQHIALTVRNSFRTEPYHPLKLEWDSSWWLKREKTYRLLAVSCGFKLSMHLWEWVF